MGLGKGGHLRPRIKISRMVSKSLIHSTTCTVLIKKVKMGEDERRKRFDAHGADF
jgi:hypothetical protein